jgi:hypothetical protein
VKTVPTLRVVSKTEALAELEALGVTDLPVEVRLALADIAGAARDGLLAMSVAAGLAVMQAMFDAEITACSGSSASRSRSGCGRSYVRSMTCSSNAGISPSRCKGSGYEACCKDTLPTTPCPGTPTRSQLSATT